MSQPTQWSDEMKKFVLATSRCLTASMVFLMLCIHAEAQPSSRNTCFDRNNRADNSREYAFLMNWIGRDLQKTVALQLALSKFGGYEGKIDGKVGPQSASVICSTLSNYLAIGGKGRNWGINSVSDAPRLIGWLYDAIVANKTGGEFPD
jgi:hypothetical protein